MRIAVIGSSGAVGRELLALLDEPGTPHQITPVASARSAGLDIGAELGLSMTIEPVRALEDTDLARFDVAFLVAGAEISRQVAETAASAGCLVIDNSSAFRMRDDVPLVVPQVNPGAIRERPASNLIANPNCSTIQLVRALNPLRGLAELRRVILSTYQAGSGGGIRGLAELADDSRQILDDGPTPLPGRFGPPLAFDVLPQIGALDAEACAHEEQKLRLEPRKIMGMPDLAVSATAVRVPVFHCHSEAVWAELSEPVEPADAEAALAESTGIRVYRAADKQPYPTARGVQQSGSDRGLVHVGRIRRDTENPRALWLWVVADNLWVGAALNAVDILRTAGEYGWLN